MTVVERLEQMPAGKLSRGSPATESAIAEIESTNQLRLPDDLRALLRWSDGVSLSSKTSFSMYDAEELTWTSSEPHFAEALPGMLILGTDNGGSVFYADVKDQIGRGPWAIYLVRMSEMGIPHSMFVGANFSEAIDTLLAGTDIYTRPELGESRS